MIEKKTISNIPDGPGVTLMRGLLTLTIFCEGAADAAFEGFCTSVTFWLFPVFVVTMEILGLWAPSSFTPRVAPPRDRPA